MKSSEEIDAIDKSRKKVRSGDDVVVKGRPLIPRQEDWMIEENSGKEKPRSYKDACVNVTGNEYDMEDEEDNWWKNDGWKNCIKVDTSRKVPNIILSEELRNKMAKRWTRTVIVSVLGMMVREEVMVRKLEQLWGDVEIIDIGSGFFMVNCKRESTYELALSGGPWLIFDHYISVQPWRSDFSLEGEKVSQIAAWIRIARLPLDYYDKGILYVLGSQVGEVLRVDRNTLSRTKGRFARVCVRLDLTKPLLPSIMINGVEKKN